MPRCDPVSYNREESAVKGIPKYRLHRGSGLAVVTLAGRDHYLGRHGTPASRAEYLAKIAEWEASGGSEPCDDATVDDLATRYIERSRDHYVKRGRATSSLDRVVRVCELARELYGPMPVGKFGVVQFKAIRHQWLSGIAGGPGLSRRTANQYAGQLREVFRWGVEEGLVPAAALQAIKAVKAIEKGRSGSPERAKIRPAPTADVELVRPLVNELARAKIDLQLLTGMRPGEACCIRTCDLDRSGPVWVYTPFEHKTEHHDRERVIPLGPKAQAIISPYLDDADPTRLVLIRPNRARKYFEGLPTPDSMVTSYRNIIRKACVKAGVPHWHPNQLRHNAATELRKRYGIEAAQLALGHASANTTEIYAEKNLESLSRIAAEVG